MTSKPPLHLVLAHHTCIAGQPIRGAVALNLRSVRDDPLDEVRVDLRGIMHISYSRRHGCGKEDILLVYESKSLWKRERYPPAGTHFLRIPFNLELPADVPPSCYVSTGGTVVRVDYKVEAIGVRSSMLRLHEKVDCSFKVVTSDAVGAPLRAKLKGGWQGPWATKTARRRIRKGLWGAHADVQLEFTYPAIPVLPLSSAIPFALSIATVSRPLPRTYDRRIWPSPPFKPHEVKLTLRQSVRVKSRTFDRTYILPLSSLWGSVDIERFPDEWYPIDDLGVKGRWKQESVFTSVFRLRCPSAFRFSRLGHEVEIQYLVHIRVKFDRFHKMSTTIPINVASGMSI
ncbi:uncharacterized protein C8Q71DRAFT_67139 [Rhodofomes roseus]|uniref:Arrestin-like N-terminal domain-containing protein n=1 Tax=Rhodofomes roseus TaxID=34475 RepID=A0ABQ8KEH4_9APHY|nr:uncharacterized protein C8Q71DRAFT_67139 [Rhodofomes roseus]KAH9836124.1 hypothetical protein C8Q71DRAFT_67139 [Rhodofomes roseus]